MIELSAVGQPLSRRLLEAPGGFLWWYFDLVDSKGDGLVVIWSFGLPFLPGHASACRRGELALPVELPSLNISVYRGGRIDFYLLQQFEPAEARWHGDDSGSIWDFGESRIRSLRARRRRIVDLDLKLDVPGLDEKVLLRAAASGPEVAGDWPSGVENTDHSEVLPRHDWRPLLCARRAGAELTVGRETSSLDGRVYHDRNGGSLPLHNLGIRWWSWGRVAMEDGELVYFVLDGHGGGRERIFLHINEDGRARRLDPDVLRDEEVERTIAGLSVWRRARLRDDRGLHLDLDFRSAVDRGPFYQRALTQAFDGQGERHWGVAEFCEPGRVDWARHRPLVRMRVHRRGEKNSMWLPLFSGPRRGRLKRFLSGLFSQSGGD